MKKTFAILLILSVFNSYCQKENNSENFTEFKSLIEKCDLTFNKPTNCSEVKTIKNPDQYYSYALKHNVFDLEIRYCIRPYDSLKAQLFEKMPQIVKSMFITTVMNMTHGKKSGFNEFPEQAVQKEFGADWGATTAVELDCEFGKGYKYAMLTTIHKNGIGDAYIFYLTNDLKQISEEIKDFSNNWFHTLKFN